jgi:hypothetical protein
MLHEMLRCEVRRFPVLRWTFGDRERFYSQISWGQTFS